LIQNYKLFTRKIVILFLIFLLGFMLRLVFAPIENIDADSFELLTAAKTINDTGRYMVPSIGTPDLKIKYHFAGWPVGFPLMLCLIFKLIGYSEFAARLFVILLGSLTIICTIMIADLLFGEKVSYLAGLLTAMNPLLVAFNGRIFTNTPSLFFFMCSITCLMLSTIKKSDDLQFVNLRIVLSSRGRIINFLLSLFFFGILLTIRDTEVIFSPIYIYILYKSEFFYFKHYNYDIKPILFLLSGVLVLLIGYAPSMYFNYQNYGKIITSTTYQWGGRLDFKYLFFGYSSTLPLPGILVILITVLVYCFPAFLLFFIKKCSDKDILLIIIFFLILIPIMIINGAYRVTSTGASPRYIIALIPFACIFSANRLIYLYKYKMLLWTFSIVILSWLFLLSYPLPVLFKITPKFAYLAHYSPLYQRYPYKNYPTHTNAVSNWIKNNTAENSVVIAPSSNPYHFFYYAKRQVITYPNLNSNVLRDLSFSRSIYLVEDHEATYNPEKVKSVKNIINASGLSYIIVGEIELFSPKVGITKMNIYKVF